MNGSSANNRAEQVWSRLAGCFGETLSRKFGDEPPPEWRSAITELNDYQLAQGMRRLKYSGKVHPPSLPEFMKLCRTIGHSDDMSDRVQPSTFPQIAHDDEFDGWALKANQRLLSFVLRCATKRRYFDVRMTRILVACKNRWADVMRAAGEGPDVVPLLDQDAAWAATMNMAEQEMVLDAAA